MLPYHYLKSKTVTDRRDAPNRQTKVAVSHADERNGLDFDVWAKSISDPPFVREKGHTGAIYFC